MQRETAKKHLAIIQAFAEGKVIEYFNTYSKEWRVAMSPTFRADMTYRVKPEPGTRTKAKIQEAQESFEAGKDRLDELQKAFEAGRSIQWRPKGPSTMSWRRTAFPAWLPHNEYRIEPRPEIRPTMDHVRRRLLRGDSWFVQHGEQLRLVLAVAEESIFVANNGWYSLEGFLSKFGSVNGGPVSRDLDLKQEHAQDDAC